MDSHEGFSEVGSQPNGQSERARSVGTIMATKEEVEEDVKHDHEHKCYICYSSPVEPSQAGGCVKKEEHIFCFDCLRRWFKTKQQCPLCYQESTFIRRNFPDDGGTIVPYSLLKKEFLAEYITEQSISTSLTDEASALTEFMRKIGSEIAKRDAELSLGTWNVESSRSQRGRATRSQTSKVAPSIRENPALRSINDERVKLVNMRAEVETLKEQVTSGRITRVALLMHNRFRRCVYELKLSRADIAHNDLRESFTPQRYRENKENHDQRLEEFLLRELPIISAPTSPDFARARAQALMRCAAKDPIHSPNFELACMNMGVYNHLVQHFTGEFFEFASSNLSQELFFKNSKYFKRTPNQNRRDRYGGGNAAEIIDLDDNDDVQVVENGDSDTTVGMIDSDAIEDLSDGGARSTEEGGAEDDELIYVHPACRMPRNLRSSSRGRHGGRGAQNGGGAINYPVLDAYGVPIMVPPVQHQLHQRPFGLDFQGNIGALYRMGSFDQYSLDRMRNRMMGFDRDGRENETRQQQQQPTVQPATNDDVILVSSDEEGRRRSEEALYRHRILNRVMGGHRPRQQHTPTDMAPRSVTLAKKRRRTVDVMSTTDSDTADSSDSSAESSSDYSTTRRRRRWPSSRRQRHDDRRDRSRTEDRRAKENAVRSADEPTVDDEGFSGTGGDSTAAPHPQTGGASSTERYSRVDPQRTSVCAYKEWWSKIRGKGTEASEDRRKMLTDVGDSIRLLERLKKEIEGEEVLIGEKENTEDAQQQQPSTSRDMGSGDTGDASASPAAKKREFHNDDEESHRQHHKRRKHSIEGSSSRKHHKKEKKSKHRRSSAISNNDPAYEESQRRRREKRRSDMAQALADESITSMPSRPPRANGDDLFADGTILLSDDEENPRREQKERRIPEENEVADPHGGAVFGPPRSMSPWHDIAAPMLSTPSTSRETVLGSSQGLQWSWLPTTSSQTGCVSDDSLVHDLSTPTAVEDVEAVEDAPGASRSE